MRTLLQRLQFSWMLSNWGSFSSRSAQNIWFNYMYWEGHLKSKIVSEPYATHCIACLFYSGQKETYFFRRSTPFPLLRGNYHFFSVCFFQNYDQNHFFVKDRKNALPLHRERSKMQWSVPVLTHHWHLILEILALCNWNNWNPNFLWVECFLAFSQWCLSLFRRKQQREIGAKLKPI